LGCLLVVAFVQVSVIKKVLFFVKKEVEFSVFLLRLSLDIYLRTGSTAGKPRFRRGVSIPLRSWGKWFCLRRSRFRVQRRIRGS
jgi:hypothetical protein